MAISGSVRDFELQKFVESPTRPGLAAVEVTGTLSVAAPVGGATEAKQDAQIVLLEAIDTKLEAPISVDANVSGTVSVDNLPAIQDVNVLSSVLPTGAATEAKQDDQYLQLVDIASSVSAIESNTDGLEAGVSNLLNPFSAPAGANYIGRSVVSDVVTWEYKSGGSGGTLLKTVTVTYTDATLETILSIGVS